jgi:hypothetical protein
LMIFFWHTVSLSSSSAKPDGKAIANVMAVARQKIIGFI